ncbi:MAG: glycosyltransferase WbuB [Sideroxydans sp.]|jgi:colanic acid biosynthesis glycosyl transferase WcaI
MRILIHGINFSPELTGIGKYSGEMAEWLAAQGHEVRVVTAPPYYPQWTIADGYVNGWRKVQKRPPPSPDETTSHSTKPASGQVACYPPLGEGGCANGNLVVYRCPLWVPAKPSGLKRILHLASFALSSFPVMLRQVCWRPDVVWVVEPALFCAPQAWLVARLSGGKVWLHIQDYEVDAAFDLGLLKGKLLRRLVATGERWLMRRFDRVSTISQRMVDRALAKGVDSGSVVLFRNWVDLKLPEPESSGLSGYRAELGIANDAVVALYSGNMGGKQGLEILADAARICWESQPTAELVFVFCGAGAGRDNLVALCENSLNVHFLELQPAERLGELLAMADIHLLPQRADAADLVMPSKLTGMLASGRPVVATAHSGTEVASVVVNCGLLVPPEDGRAFAEAIKRLALDATLRAKLGQAGRNYALEYLDKEEVLGDFAAELAAIADKA